MVNKLAQSIAFQKEALGLRAHRQQIIAANIANADTPNYQARDVDFSSALKEAVAGRQTGGISLSLTSSRHLPASGEPSPVTLMYRKEVQPSADGNTVDMDIERAQFAENSLYYEAGVTFLTGRFKTMLSAIQGQ